MRYFLPVSPFLESFSSLQMQKLRHRSPLESPDENVAVCRECGFHTVAVQYILKPMNTSIVPHAGSPGTEPIPFPRENSGSPAWKELRWTHRPLRPRCAGDRKARSGACSWTGGAKREAGGRQGKASRNQTLVEPFAFWLKAESHKDFKSRQRRKRVASSKPETLHSRGNIEKDERWP